MSKLTNEQKGHNSKVNTGVRVLQNKMCKVKEELDHEEEVIRLNSNLRGKLELADARCIVSENNIIKDCAVQMRRQVGHAEVRQRRARASGALCSLVLVSCFLFLVS